MVVGAEAIVFWHSKGQTERREPGWQNGAEVLWEGSESVQVQVTCWWHPGSSGTPKTWFSLGVRLLLWCRRSRVMYPPGNAGAVKKNNRYFFASKTRNRNKKGICIWISCAFQIAVSKGLENQTLPDSTNLIMVSSFTNGFNRMQKMLKGEEEIKT